MLVPVSPLALNASTKQGEPTGGRLRHTRWLGVLLIFLYWSSALWTPAFFELLGFGRSAGIDPRKWPNLVRALQMYHWPHKLAFDLIGSRLYDPEKMFFPEPWTMWVAELVPAVACAAVWWLALTLYLRRSDGG